MTDLIQQKGIYDANRQAAMLSRSALPVSLVLLPKPTTLFALATTFGTEGRQGKLEFWKTTWLNLQFPRAEMRSSNFIIT